MLAIILKFGILEHCHIKSDEHFKLAKSLVNINNKLEGAMQNISGLESNMRSCYQSLEVLNLQIKSPMYCEEIESLSHALSVRKVARKKLNDLIHSEFIADPF
jgi:predicted  nucleic acid-binding Zn-ribbon protein